ncbi:MAG: nucleoside phosphorylase-like protein [Candidatus Sumerlaeota bacterium]|nr:nucleoside phosphorylase-like protein [Candidatus Sumerlaeota bacterium]
MEINSPSLPDMRADYLLFVVTKTEKEKLEETAKEMGFSFDKINGRFCPYYDLGTIGRSKILAAQTEMGPFSYGGSASRAINCIAETGATGMVSLGMAFGVDPKRQKIGDIIVSKALLPYDYRIIKSEDGKIVNDYSEMRIYGSQLSLIAMLEKESRNKEWQGEVKVRFGALLTGAAKIHCQKFRDDLVSNLRDCGEPIIGGEMEGLGLLSVSAPENPLWVVAKGISDFADEKRDEIIKTSRLVACKNSARFVLQALKNEHA